MSYSIDISLDIYSQWESNKRWLDIDEARVTYSEWIRTNYEGVTCSAPDHPGLTRTFTFESEEYYNWFLLQQ